jgi:hypothetical protein
MFPLVRQLFDWIATGLPEPLALLVLGGTFIALSVVVRKAAQARSARVASPAELRTSVSAQPPALAPTSGAAH